MKEIENQVLNSTETVGHNQILRYLFNRCVKAEYQNRRLLAYFTIRAKELIENYIHRPIQKLKYLFSRRIERNNLIDHEMVRPSTKP